MFSRYAAPAKLPISVLFPNEGSHTPKGMLIAEKGELDRFWFLQAVAKPTTNGKVVRTPLHHNHLRLIIGFAEQQ